MRAFSCRAGVVFLFSYALLCAAALGLAGCATKEFVLQQVADSNLKINDLGSKLTEKESRLQAQINIDIQNLDRFKQDSTKTMETLQKLVDENKSAQDNALSQAQTKLNTEIRKNQTDISENQRKLDDLQAQLKTQIASLDTMIKSLDTKIAQTNDDIKTQSNTLSKKIGAVQTELLGEVSKAQDTAVKTLKNSLSLFTSMREAIQNHKQLLENVQQSLSAVNKSYQETVTASQKAIDEAKSMIDKSDAVSR